jgi:hypothetical protein
MYVRRLTGWQRNRATLGRRGSLAVALLVAALCIDALAAGSATAAAPVAVYAEPPSVNAFIGGQPAQVEVWVSPIASPGLGSFQIDAGFDPVLVSVSAQPGPFLASTGNAITCTTTHPSSASIRLSCTATDHPSSGPTGNGVIAVFEVQPSAALQLRAAAGNGQVTSLDLPGAVIRDVNRVVAPIGELADAVIAVRALEGDVNADCTVDATDNDIVAARYPSTSQMVTYDLRYDVEPADADGDIDLRDLQFVFGRNGSSCDAPVPAQPPPPASPVADDDADGGRTLSTTVPPSRIATRRTPMAPSAIR